MTPRSDEDEAVSRYEDERRGDEPRRDASRSKTGRSVPPATPSDAKRPTLDELLGIFAAEQARVEADAHAPAPTSPLEAASVTDPIDVAEHHSARDVSPYEDEPGDDENATQPDGRRFGKLSLTIASWAGVLVAALTFLVLGGLILVPRAMGWQGMVVLSGSMEPALKTGGLAFVQPLSREQIDRLKPGDIITFRNSAIAGLVSHRIVQVNQGDGGPSFVTKGDANPQPDDGQVAAASVVGKVRFSVPYLGRLVERLHNRSTYLLFLGIPAGLLIAGELWNIASELQRARREKTAHTDVEGAVS